MELLLTAIIAGERLFAPVTDFSIMEEVEEEPRHNLPTTHFCKML